MENIEHFVEIAAVKKRQTTTYRFYGRGVWKVKSSNGWVIVNAIHVPGCVLQVAASQCASEPPRHPSFLSEVEIARLCGGRIL